MGGCSVLPPIASLLGKNGMSQYIPIVIFFVLVAGVLVYAFQNFDIFAGTFFRGAPDERPFNQRVPSLQQNTTPPAQSPYYQSPPQNPSDSLRVNPSDSLRVNPPASYYEQPDPSYGDPNAQ